MTFRTRSAAPRRRRAVPLALALLAGGLIGLPSAAAAAPPPAPVPPAPVVTLVGSLQSELGCAADWVADCAATALKVGRDGIPKATFQLPAGSYEFKFTVGGTWDENYGAGGTAGGANMPLVLQAPARITVSFDPETHVSTVTPAAAQPGLTRADKALAGDSLRESLTRERFYFVMTDRFANGDPTNDTGGYEPVAGQEARLATGFDPADKGFYQGGDLRGLIDNVDYIKGMGHTAIWLTPSFKNRPVQGVGENVSAGYHGYWITDFTQIDPHLGTNDELKELVDKAHANGMKVFFDIITNHTADVIATPSPYISKETRPYTDAAGVPFDDTEYAAGDTFPALDAATSFPYVPTFPTVADETVKVPAWLNDPTLYHNRGNASFDGTEGDVYGDFVGLDDLFTTNPTVRDGMIDVYSFWAAFGIDGFRIDTVKHVNVEFWQKFAPETRAAAAAAGKPEFFEFGEVYDANPMNMSYFTTTGGLQATLDFGFQARAAGFGNSQPTRDLAQLYAGDDWYTDADSNAYQLPTFLGNHDMGRIGNFLNAPGISDDELLQRDLLVQQLMYLTRGQPVTYYGDEQGFTGDGGDKDARQSLFASQVASYNDDRMIGAAGSTATDNYATDVPIYTALGDLAELRDAHPALADGAQLPRYSSDEAGVFAFSRIDAGEQVEYVVALNNSDVEKTVQFDVLNAATKYTGLWGGAATVRSNGDRRISVTVPALTAQVWKADRKLARSHKAPQPVFTTDPGATVGGRAAVSVAVPQGGFNQVSFAWRPVGTTEWTKLGTDDNAPYRVFHDVSSLPKGTMVEYRAVLQDHSGNLSVASSNGIVGDPVEPPVAGGAQNDPPETQPDSVTIAGDLDSELGCPGDWQPDCAAAMLTLDPADGIWKGTFDLPAGTWQYKAALNGNWTENYGAGAARDGGNIVVVHAGGPITFLYDHATHWVTSTSEGDIITLAGSHQSELGCAADWSPDCARPWLQDPDGDGIFTFSTALLPAGSYEAKVAHGLSWDENYGAGGVPNGANIVFTAVAGAVTVFTYDSTTHVLTVTSAAATAADLTLSKAQWLNRGWIAWDLPAQAPQWHYRLHWAAEGGLDLDATAVTGGSSISLTRDALPKSLQRQYPHLAGYDGLRLPISLTCDVKTLAAILKGQVVVAAYDDAGTLMDATGVQLPGVLDDLYRRAGEADLGVTWKKSVPTLSVWAPTAHQVDVELALGSSTTTVPMKQDRDGVWSVKGEKSWKNATYRYQVQVYVPSTGAVETNLVTDPYSLGLTTDSERSVVTDLSDSALKPTGWDRLSKPALARSVDSSIYELHVRDFSVGDSTVPAAERGTYLAFARPDSDGMKHLKALSAAGLTTVHLLPVFDLGTVPENRADQQTPACDLPALTAADPAGTAQQQCVSQVAATDGFNWGYDPVHYTTPEGSYATNPEGTGRTKEFRQMVAGLNGSGLRVVMDVVYNHTTAAGQDPKSVLDKVVPGYYHRLSATGAIETSTCCPNTATEHLMMDKLTIDSVLTWATQYKVDGFRFDLMGHMPKQTMLDLRKELDRLTVKRDGVDGKQIQLYGEGWNFGEVADDARFVQATQQNMAGTGIGTFNDRLRDAVRGGGPFDENPGAQGFATGLFTDPNTSGANGTEAEQRAKLLADQDLVKLGLVGNLANYRLVDAQGATVKGSELDYNGAPAGYTQQPGESITYVDAHDNETLFDALAYKLPTDTPMADRVRMNTVALSTTALGQGPMFWHAGTDLLRSKSLDRDSYNSGDWFNRIDWTGQQSTFGSGLPPEAANSAKWDFMKPLLADPTLVPTPADIAASRAAAVDLLKLRSSSPLFRLGAADLISQKVSFLTAGPDQAPGVIVMQIDDRVGKDVDRKVKRIVVVFNASPAAQTVAVSGASGLTLSPVQAGGSDAVVKGSTVSATGVTVPARTVAVFLQ